jgi:lipoprotein signal peptidase
MSKFFDFYKNGNFIIKVIFLGVALIMGILWIVGSLTKLDRLIMFMIGTIIGGALINIFLYEYVSNAIVYISTLF